jgi:purine nucleosidase
MPIDRRNFLAATVAAGLLAALGQSRVRASLAATSGGKKKLLFDTDIGSDIDDAIALSYLLAQPQCDLLGITTVTGEPVKRAEMASAICKLAGRGDIPIYPGAAFPLVAEQKQPLAPQHAALGDWPHETKFPSGEAVEFLRRTIRAHPGEITLLAVGPMTNLGLLFRTDPEIPRLLKELVLMCGKFSPKPMSWGHTEWNAIVDPEATAIVFGSNAPVLRSYGLDVTLQVSLTREEMARSFATDVRLRQVLAFAQVWFAKADKIHFHDPLAAVSVFAPDICGLERGNVTVDLKEGPDRGRTVFQPDATGRHETAATVDPARFFAEYFKVFGPTNS